MSELARVAASEPIPEVGDPPPMSDLVDAAASEPMPEVEAPWYNPSSGHREWWVEDMSVTSDWWKQDRFSTRSPSRTALTYAKKMIMGHNLEVDNEYRIRWLVRMAITWPQVLVAAGKEIFREKEAIEDKKRWEAQSSGSSRKKKKSTRRSPSRDYQGDAFAS